MNYIADDKSLIIQLEGRLYSENAAEIGDEIRECIQEHPGQAVCLDLEKLNYISSSGLRVVLSLRKELGDKFRIINVIPEVYDVLDITGMTSLMEIRRKPRDVSVEGCEIIGRGAFGTVYKLNGDTVIKVYEGGEEVLPGIEKEQQNAKQAFMCGLPTAIPFDIVKAGNKYGTVFEMINARTCNDIICENLKHVDIMIPKYAEFLKQINTIEGVPGQLRNIRDKYIQYMDVIGPYLNKHVKGRITSLLMDMPDNHHLVHGDIQMKNVMVSGDELVLIDMDHLGEGDPVFELGSLYATYIAFNEDEEDNSEKFLGLNKETCSRIFWETLNLYLPEMNDRERQETICKIRIAGYLRFLKILLIEMAGVQNDLKDIRIRHTAEKLDDLVSRVRKLNIC